MKWRAGTRLSLVPLHKPRDSWIYCLLPLFTLFILFRFVFFAISLYFTIGSCFNVHYRVIEPVGSLESTKEA